jgi:hypothetical protein
MGTRDRIGSALAGTALLEGGIDLGVCIASVGRHSLRPNSGCSAHFIYLWLDQIAFIRLAGRHLDVENGVHLVVDRRALLIGRF